MAAAIVAQDWSAPFDWIDELDLDPESSSLRLGTRHLGDRPWLIADSATEAELAAKHKLTRESPEAVFAAIDQTWRAGQDVLGLVTKSQKAARVTESDPQGPVKHPLLRAGLLVQEDLCLLARRPDGWHLAAATLHCPSRWLLADKIGHHITQVHSPVEGYAKSMSRRVDALLDGLGNEPILRRNWFIHEDDLLFQPVPPRPRVVGAQDCADQLTVRSERQTLRSVGAHILFTIRVQRCPLGALLERRANDLRAYVYNAPDSEQRRRGLLPEQIRALRDLLA